MVALAEAQHPQSACQHRGGDTAPVWALLSLPQVLPCAAVRGSEPLNKARCPQPSPLAASPCPKRAHQPRLGAQQAQGGGRAAVNEGWNGWDLRLHTWLTYIQL